MSKLLAFTILILGFSAMLADAKGHRPRPSKKCSIAYYDAIQPPVCEFETNENGEQGQICSQNGSASYLAELNRKMSSFSEDWSVSEINFSGDCDCVLQLWSGNDKTGDTFTHEFSSDMSHFFNSDIWDQENNSFEIRCTF